MRCLRERIRPGLTFTVLGLALNKNVFGLLPRVIVPSYCLRIHFLGISIPRQVNAFHGSVLVQSAARSAQWQRGLARLRGLELENVELNVAPRRVSARRFGNSEEFPRVARNTSEPPPKKCCFLKEQFSSSNNHVIP